MKLIRYIFLTLLLPVFPAGAQNLCGSRVQVANPSILIGDNGRVMIGMDVPFRPICNSLPTVWLHLLRC